MMIKCTTRVCLPVSSGELLVDASSRPALKVKTNKTALKPFVTQLSRVLGFDAFEHAHWLTTKTRLLTDMSDPSPAPSSTWSFIIASAGTVFAHASTSITTRLRSASTQIVLQVWCQCTGLFV